MLRPAAYGPRRENRHGGIRTGVAGVHDDALDAAYRHPIKTNSGRRQR
jgi:hypothetical protein